MRSSAPRRSVVATAALVGFLLGVAFSVGGHLSASSRAEPSDLSPKDRAAQEDDPLPRGQAVGSEARRTAVVEAVARTAPAVASIDCEVLVQSPFSMFSGPATRSAGSGTLIRADGIVLTNAHVVKGASRITATLADDTSYNASLVGLDEDLDLAVLQLENAQNLPVVPLGTSEGLLLGEPVIAIGNPFGLGHTVTTGVVSSQRRSLEVAERVFQDYIQTDAGINPGNSGGPLLNIQGELIGINTAIRRDAENIGFAIPVDRAAKVARDLLRYGSVRAPWLGVALADVGGPRYRGTDVAEGAVVVDTVDPEGAAEGVLEKGDILLQAGDRPVRSRADLNLWLATRQPGERVPVQGLREGQPFSVEVQAVACPDSIGARLLAQDLGIEVQALDARTARTYGLSGVAGVVVGSARRDGSFARAGLRAGDVILAVHGSVVRNPAELQTALARARGAHAGSVLLTVQRGPYRGHVEVAL
ncbi:MAG: trypsin-like peptidase domain-containing protein [Deltaproteobacteria bacterium]|nr:trypsin-like peptidase domain-containing protein [Deltaproteobacteria bacterium]